MAALYNKTVLILGGGPSLLDLIDDVERVLPIGPDYAIIAINEAIYLSLYADILFFRDLSWFFGNRDIVNIWNGTVISSTPSQFYPKKIKVVKTTHCDNFLIGGDTIKYGRTSGHLAVSLAINMGAKCCVLLGFDCRTVDGRSHFHDRPSNACSVLYENDFLPAWDGWGDAAWRADVEIVNATPDSAILEFPYRSLSEILT